MNILKPTSANFQTFLYIGSGLIFISIFDVFLRSFFNLNFLTFLPGIVNTLFPLIIGLIGLQMIRLEYSGNRLVDKINQKVKEKINITDEANKLEDTNTKLENVISDSIEELDDQDPFN